jgi:uncharacterized protein HemX
VLIFDLEAAIVGLEPLQVIRSEHSETRDRQGGEHMNLRHQGGQTGIAVLAFVIALVALGISVYTYFQVAQRADTQTQLTRMQELVERGRQEIGDALRRLEEQVRGSQSRESPSR